MQEESHLTEAALRQALERMGVDNKTPSRQRPGKAPGERGQPTRERFSLKSKPVGATQIRRRRFASDDAVVVEHQALSRTAQKRVSANRAPVAGDGEDEVKRLRESLERERRRVRDADAEISELGNRVKAAETHVMHLRLQVDENAKALLEKDEEVLRLKAELHQAQEQKVRKRAAVTTRVSANKEAQEKVLPQEEADEPQPVQWWSD